MPEYIYPLLGCHRILRYCAGISHIITVALGSANRLLKELQSCLTWATFSTFPVIDWHWQSINK